MCPALSEDSRGRRPWRSAARSAVFFAAARHRRMTRESSRSLRCVLVLAGNILLQIFKHGFVESGRADHVFLAGPVAQIKQLASLAAKREIGARFRIARLLANGAGRLHSMRIPQTVISARLLLLFAGGGRAAAAACLRRDAGVDAQMHPTQVARGALELRRK